MCSSETSVDNGLHGVISQKLIVFLCIIDNINIKIQRWGGSRVQMLIPNSMKACIRGTVLRTWWYCKFIFPCIIEKQTKGRVIPTRTLEGFCSLNKLQIELRTRDVRKSQNELLL
jgi:hypothetical protein